MFKNFIKIALRNLWKSKGYAFINIVGLSVAFCVSVFLFLTAYFALSYDSFHADKDRIYEPYFFSNDPEGVGRTASMPFPITPALKAEYPDIEAVARIVNGSDVVEYKGKYLDKNIKFTEPDFFKIFSFPFKQGSPQAALQDLSNIVITEHMAKAVFGEEDPMGKRIQLGLEESKKEYVVSGVLADFPENSSLQFDAFIRSENVGGYQQQKDQWDAFSHNIFLKLKPGVDKLAFEKKLKPFTAKYFAETLTKLKKKGAKPDERGDIYTLRLQKLEDIHFNREISGGKEGSLIYALMGIGIFILLIACINFINLSVARSFIRAREVGVRKSLGALKQQLFLQIWGEAGVICFLGFLTGIVLAILLLPAFNATFRAKLSLEYIFEPDKMAMLIALFLFVTLVAGGYPALQMSKFNAVEVLKGKVSLKKPGILRNSLIVAQFALSSLLICCTIIAVQQVDHLRKQPLGFQKEEVISIPVGSKVNGQTALRRMRNRLADDPNVVAITGTGVNLGLGLDRSSSRSSIGFTFKEREVETDWLHISYDYLKTLNIKLRDGREFNPAYPTDSMGRVIITESMAKAIGEKDPVGKFFQTDTAGIKHQIIGVVPDFNLYSSKTNIKPITMYLSHTDGIGYIFVRVTPQSLASSMEKLKSVWKEITPESEFMGSFLDENTNNWYKEEERLSQVFSLASSVAIILSCLGLFAVALIVMEQRTKEIGVRKVLGASIASLVFVLSKDFVKLVLIAILIATPAAWYFMQLWLDNYPYRIEISPLVFIGVGAAALLVAIATVSFQSIKAALMNPVKSLRSE
ncbi:ABC-type transport system, involved in lipoprotein release, permease component [Dyadobacter soli]|uniref:ABC-type transport system, involved in lipoprotein release, permease component n=1 Tax=Dyadobacter soli TaxID=659014 RepID=A0A1G7HPB5_9BACT|nr:ABC transporter permease [Dyadobacter soli]SDF02114.1 ABC-type transport system, involved in lipoprotein release, permease component [Dyadobacter soli]